MEVAVTFDLDLMDYVSKETVQDEFEMIWPHFINWCNSMPEYRTTWFIRIDEQMKEIYGAEDYIFLEHREKIQWLRDNGHEIAWHFHSFIKEGNSWIQNTDSEQVSAEMRRVYSYVEKQNLKYLRMGWAYHTNETMRTANELGIKIDFSALPRPKYSWDNPLRDWSLSTSNAYHPSKQNYQISGNENLEILEIPISTAVLPLNSDTDMNVLRYINPAYHSEYFKKCFVNMDGFNLISHPYESLPNAKNHELISFDPMVYYENIKWLKSKGIKFLTLSEYKNKITKNNKIA